MKSRLWWLSLTAVVASLPNSQESRQPPVAGFTDPSSFTL